MGRMKTDFGIRDLILIGTIAVSIAVFVTKIDAMTDSLQSVVEDHEGRITELEKCELKRQGYEQAIQDMGLSSEE